MSGESRSQEICVEGDEVDHSSQSQEGFFFFISVFFVANCISPPLRTHGKNLVVQISSLFICTMQDDNGKKSITFIPQKIIWLQELCRPSSFYILNMFFPVSQANASILS